MPPLSEENKMKIKTVLVAGLAGGIAYVLGTKAGRGRYEELKVQADKLRLQVDRLANSPQVRETVATVADKVKETAEKLPDPVADVVAKVTGSTAGSTEPATGSAPSQYNERPATPQPTDLPTTSEVADPNQTIDPSGPVEPGIRPGV
jgi:hypothetical protein